MASIGNKQAVLTAVLFLVWLQPERGDSADYIRRSYSIEAALLSYMPGMGIGEFENHGSGVAVGGGTLGFGVSINGVPVVVEISHQVEEGRLLATIDLGSDEAKRSLGFESQTLDLTNLRPTAIHLATLESGRVYQLNVTPGVQVIDNTPESLDVSEFQIHNWRFPDSPVLVDDAVYVGRLGFAQSPVAFVDISGVARVEFSLYQLTGAEPWGVLDDGVVTLTHPESQTTIQISNVRNGGAVDLELPGGPYRVWVRWSAPTFTVEEHWEELADMRERIVSGEIPNADTSYLDKQLAREPSPWIHSSGVRGLRKGERVGVTE